MQAPISGRSSVAPVETNCYISFQRAVTYPLVYEIDSCFARLRATSARKRAALSDVVLWQGARELLTFLNT